MITKQTFKKRLSKRLATLIVVVLGGLLLVLFYAALRGPNYSCKPLGDPAFRCGYWEYVEYILFFPGLILLMYVGLPVLVGIVSAKLWRRIKK
ncbi:MAG: hypothetical protein JWL89_296 [Candidatus Saccharibacteria bacterium]|nr:hypothetical protein [Candidatus Saccharibacteria bacterium]